MSKKSIFCIVALILAAQFSAQSNAFNKTTWKIEPRSADGKTVLKKAKKLNLPDEQSKFHYLQFDQDHYQTGTSCFGMTGTYQVYDNQTIEFSEGMAGMSGDCEEPKSLIGNYSYVVKQDLIELTPVSPTETEENYETEDINDAAGATIDAAKDAAKEVQKSQKKSRKK